MSLPHPLQETFFIGLARQSSKKFHASGAQSDVFCLAGIFFKAIQSRKY